MHHLAGRSIQNVRPAIGIREHSHPTAAASTHRFLPSLLFCLKRLPFILRARDPHRSIGLSLLSLRRCVPRHVHISQPVGRHRSAAIQSHILCDDIFLHFKTCPRIVQSRIKHRRRLGSRGLGLRSIRSHPRHVYPPIFPHRDMPPSDRSNRHGASRL